MPAPSDRYLMTNTMLFAERMCQSISDMVGVTFNVKVESFAEQLVTSDFKMIAVISFSGTIQGNYLCALDEITALKLIGAYAEGMDSDSIKEMRADFSGFIKEMLNLSVGQSIVELEKNFGDMTFNPATVIYGELEFPDIRSGSVMIESEIGSVLCGFSLNLVNLKIGQKLEEALNDLEKRTVEAQEARKNVACIFELLPVGLVAIDKAGLILPGYSKSTQILAGVSNETSLVGKFLPEILKTELSIAERWKNWLDLVFTKYNYIPFKDLVGLCNLNEIKNLDGEVFKLDWLPVADNQNSDLKKLLVVIEDVTKQHELEKRMEDLSVKHQENLELISQIINLGPEEVTNFIYDSSQLLTDAQKIVEGDSQDRELINELFRTFHTLKGSFGQYQFKSLQEMAHKVEDHLRIYQDTTIRTVDDRFISEVKTSIEDARNYLSRIQDIRIKLGAKDETLRQKASRDPSTVMVEIQRIDNLRLCCENLIRKCKSTINDIWLINEMEYCCQSIYDLKKLKLSFFLASLEMLARNSCDKVGKKVSLSISHDLAIEVEIIRPIHQCLIHLINNAIDHGIELPEERLQRGKVSNGIVVISGQENVKNYIITVEDDGKGIDIVAIKEKISSEYHVSVDTIENMSEQELYSYLFKPGFTTKKATSSLSGRGVGMDFVYHTVKKAGGDVSVSSIYGKGTMIKIILPCPEP
jgi:signal transduction histidine kinase/CheY-specific phosphatase CheX